MKISALLVSAVSDAIQIIVKKYSLSLGVTQYGGRMGAFSPIGVNIANFGSKIPCYYFFNRIHTWFGTYHLGIDEDYIMDKAVVPCLTFTDLGNSAWEEKRWVSFKAAECHLQKSDFLLTSVPGWIAEELSTCSCSWKLTEVMLSPDRLLSSSTGSGKLVLTKINDPNHVFCLLVCLLPQSFHAMPACGDKTVLSFCRDQVMH